MLFKNTIELIGKTPLIHLSNIYNMKDGKILAKLESVNPGGSVKDRPALKIIQKAYAEKKLITGQPVVEMTSGNMGAGLAVVCNIYKNPFIAVMSEGNSPARIKMMQAFGAEVVLVPQVEGKLGQVTGKDIGVAVDKAKEITAIKKGFYVDQFNNIASVLAHEEGTGPEIWQALNGQLDAFVAAVGSGGTFIGCSRFLKTKNKNVYCVAVEPVGSEILAGKAITNPRHIMQGIGYGIIPPHWEPELADEILSVSDEEAGYYKSLLATKESLHVGFSSGANVCAAIKLLDSNCLKPGATVVTILCDHGLKY